MNTLEDGQDLCGASAEHGWTLPGKGAPNSEGHETPQGFYKILTSKVHLFKIPVQPQCCSF